MQDLHSIATGRILGSALERRLRPLAHGHVQSALKCPRCDSTNTKFCYYNNYNLSQPRHFCKSCRRYWTKGGVLRNVPVGGGCRKNKRPSKPKTSQPTADQLPPAKTDANAVAAEPQNPITAAALPLKSGSNESSSESSGATAPSLTACSGSLLGVPNYEPFMFPASDTTVLVGQRTEPGGYTADVGSFSGVVRGSSEAITGGVELSSVMVSQQQCQINDTCQQPEWESQDQCQTAMIGGLFDQTVQLDLSVMGSGGFGPSDWQVKDQGVFDLAQTTVDQAYWSQPQTQWTDRDQGRGPESLLPLNFSQFLF